MQSWRMMVFPFESFNLIIEFGEIISPPTHIKHSKVLAVLLLYEVCNLEDFTIIKTYIVDVVSVHLFKA